MTKTISVDLMSATSRFIKTLKVSVLLVAKFIDGKPTWVLTYDNIVSAVRKQTSIKYHHIAFNRE